jgi:hypothetical protein
MRQLLAILLLFGAGCVERSTVQAGRATPPPTASTTAANGTSAKTCPTPSPDVICTKEYKPVVCEGCEYANACIAGAAGFKAEQCAPKNEDAAKKCPEPKPDVICPMQYAPVVCEGCRYSNACVAGAAGFKKEQCAPAPDEE